MKKLLFALLCSPFLGACGSDLTPRAWEVHDPPPENAGHEAGDIEPNDEAGQADECANNEDCSEGEYCHRPSACDGVRYCVEGYEPWSAAPPRPVCGCNGQTTSVNAGYPGPHAWELGRMAGWDTTVTRPCDSDAEPPFDFVLRFQIVDELPDDGVVIARLNDSLQTDEREKVVDASGVVEFRATGDEWANFSVEVLVDRDGDGDCSESTDIVYGSYHGDEIAVNLETFEADFDLKLQSHSTVCANW